MPPISIIYDIYITIKLGILLYVQIFVNNFIQTTLSLLVEFYSSFLCWLASDGSPNEERRLDCYLEIWKYFSLGQGLGMWSCSPVDIPQDWISQLEGGELWLWLVVRDHQLPPFYCGQLAWLRLKVISAPRFAKTKCQKYLLFSVEKD